MDRATLLQLAERCEREEPSRELGDDIAVALGYCLHLETERSGAQSDTGRTCKACGADSWGNRSNNGLNQRLHDRLPAFTTSLDAAVTLVPKGWTLRMTESSDGYFFVSLHGGAPVIGRAVTEAMARCACALRARAAGA